MHQAGRKDAEGRAAREGQSLGQAAVLLEESERRWRDSEGRETEADARCSEAEVRFLRSHVLRDQCVRMRGWCPIAISSRNMTESAMIGFT